MISVVVVDDEHLVRSGFAALLASDPEITVVGTADSGDAALAVVRRERPDVVLMDIRMPGRDGVSATAAITADPALSETRVIVLTTFDLDEYVHAALRAGASGFLLKDAQPTDLLAAVHLVAQGESVLARRWCGGSSPHSSKPRHLAEAGVVGLADATGDRGPRGCRPRPVSNAEIGDALYMSAATAKTHVGRLLTKLDARDRTHLVIAAYEAGLIKPRH